MRFSKSRAFNLLATASAVACTALTTTAHAAQPASAQVPSKAAQSPQTWSAWGGTVGVRWNRDLAGDVGMTITAGPGKLAELGQHEGEMFDLRAAGSLDFDVRNGNLFAFLGGSLQARGGHVIDTPSGRIDLTDFKLVPRAGGTTPILDVIGSDGTAWFYVDRLMYELIDNNQRLAVRTMDLRISAELAQRLGHPEVAGWAIADMELTTDVLRQGEVPQPQVARKWHGTAVPGVPGATYKADLFMQTFVTQYMRCLGCTGAGGNGQVVFAPSSTLRNNVNNGTAVATVPGDPLGTSTALYTADIPWYQKFTGPFAPYANDQHPYLIWNLYRFNADGSIDQIGRSGVKHAFLTLNTNCIENPNNAHILGRGCADVYSTGNNDSNNSLGPRSEIIPASNIWGRCGSVYDRNCDGVQNSSGYGSYDQRLVVRESQFSGAAHAGATYRFESWYLAREDVNVLNSMASTNNSFTRPSTVWVVGGNNQFRLGPAIDRWVDPAAPGPNARSTYLQTTEGNAKVAMKATDLGSGRWRYDYAVMNLDFARATTVGNEPNLRVVSNRGFDSFSIPVGPATVTDLQFSDGDLVPDNDWIPAIRKGVLSWTSAVRDNGLDWGVMFRFSFIVNKAPVASAVQVRVAARGIPQSLEAAAMLAPHPAGEAPPVASAGVSR